MWYGCYQQTSNQDTLWVLDDGYCNVKYIQSGIL